MVFLLIILCLFFVVVGLRCSHNNIFSPSVMTGTIWAGSLFLFLVLGQKLPDLSFNFCLCLFLWISCTCLSSLYAQSATYRDSKLDEPGLLIRNIYLIYSVIWAPILYEFVTKVMLLGTSGSLALDLRLAAIGKGSGFSSAFGGLFVIIWQVSFLLEALCFDKKKWWRFALITFIYASFGIVTMSKITFLNIFLFGTSIFYFKKRISLKHLLMGIGVLLFLFLTLQSIRQAIKFSDVDDSFFITYIVSNLSAFDTLKPCTSLHFGENTFRFIYAMFYDLEWSRIEPVDIMLKWINKPIQTNTYTAMYPYYVDFGKTGLVIFPILMGTIYGWIYKKAEMGSNFHIVLYAVVINIIFMQYAADLFFTSFSGNVKLFIFILIPFLATKHNLLVIKKRITGND